MNEPKPIEPLILTLRDQRVILDADLAKLYGVSTKRLNEQVKRNANRFPEDFMFQLTSKEWKNLKSQFATSSLEDAGSNRSQIATGSLEVVEKAGDAPNRSQIVTGSQRHRDPRFMPYAFTEHGAIMAASILNSPEAVAMSVFVVRAFVQMRERLVANAEIIKRLAEIDKTLLEHDQALSTIWRNLQPLLAPPPDPPKRKIGFDYKGDEESILTDECPGVAPDSNPVHAGDQAPHWNDGATPEEKEKNDAKT